MVTNKTTASEEVRRSRVQTAKACFSPSKKGGSAGTKRLSSNVYNAGESAEAKQARREI